MSANTRSGSARHDASEPRPASFIGPSGTAIGYETWGDGPPLVLVHGAFSDHRTNWTCVKPFLKRHFTGYALSRRGRGATGGSTDRRIEEEAEDAAALIRQIGAPVFLLGHSHGAHVALAAAARVPELVRKLVLYEAPWPYLCDATTMALLEPLAEAEDWDGFATTFFAEVLAVPRADLDALGATEDWSAILADAPASYRDIRAMSRYRFDPEAFGALPVPVLLQVGSESPPDFYVTEALATVLPDAAVEELEGQAHEGMTTAPEQYAEAVSRFLLP